MSTSSDVRFLSQRNPLMTRFSNLAAIFLCWYVPDYFLNEMDNQIFTADDADADEHMWMATNLSRHRRKACFDGDAGP